MSGRCEVGGASVTFGLRTFLAALLLAGTGFVRAGDLGPVVGEASVTWHDGVIRLGDSRAQVRKIAGRYPDQALPLYVDDKYPIGERWTFSGGAEDRRILHVELTHGRVSRLWIEPLIGDERPLSER